MAFRADSSVAEPLRGTTLQFAMGQAIVLGCAEISKDAKQLSIKCGGPDVLHTRMRGAGSMVGRQSLDLVSAYSYLLRASKDFLGTERTWEGKR